MSLPTTQKLYRIFKREGIENLELHSNEPVPQTLLRNQVLVRLRAASLNFRDVLVVTGKYPSNFPSDGLIPLSDGAGEVVAIGENVKEFKVGDRVAGIFTQDWVNGEMKDEYMTNVLGGSAHGVLSQYRVFEKHSIVKIPQILSYEEAATLPCAALTAFHALYENGIKPVGAGQTVLVLGTGGVSVFAIQFALASGATVIVTSSNDEKLKKAIELGAHHTINYSTTPNWDEKVRELTNGRGVDHVIEVGGSGTLQKSLKAVRRNGQVHMIGVLSKNTDPNFDVGMQVLFGGSILRGFIVGSREMFENMNRVIEQHKIHPVVDKVFKFEEAKEALHHLLSQKHVGKVVISIE
ncbi:hypothetical protein C9374_007705 [Naegleria lovaniensis]|uniref:Enoyl reductase (ER) domain-containing protein n=1 Tax=Naegleria lovaniensis TaxID=51637 RepID=A0AA88GKI4_NAELO|nr:uncharacterized protein C9374_007705 [Naegleria lovaniensis]KAG2379067.1 hypothetical protein C9374_007705 [Naegleria lovaniensis]